jgi:hypothetical protein
MTSVLIYIHILAAGAWIGTSVVQAVTNVACRKRAMKLPSDG